MKHALSSLFAGVLLVALVLTGCKSASPQSNDATQTLAPVKLAQGEPLRIVATTSIVADIARNVGGDAIQITTLLPLGTDPHTFQGAPRDVAALSDAHLILANGAGLEEFLEPLIESAKTNGAVVHLSEGIAFRQLSDHDEDAHTADDEDQHKTDTDHEYKGIDPHTWTTPANAIVFTRNAERALSALDPANGESYKANADAYVAQLQILDAWVKTQIETIPPDRRKLVTDHQVYGYYADRYGLTQVGAVISSFSTAAEPGAREIAELEQAIRQEGVTAIFVGVGLDAVLVERIAGDTGIRVVELYDGSLGPTGSGAETYLDHIRYNTMAIVKALR